MQFIYSKIQRNLLLHIVIRPHDFEKERQDVIAPYHALQLAILKMESGKTFQAHRHIPHEKKSNVAAQEAWVVLVGKVKAIFYDIDGAEPIDEVILNGGDISVTLAGGHNYEIMRKNSRIAEFKSGPYLGQEMDKKFIE